ncbi:vesicle coat component [Saxophila tyrrhenica]|uniref:Protein transport protein sec16 n=1 Tax=Saxophila tyrrhenica TaxID=1690608 RepID=A0AAV9PIB6_9PEZI|nr:vesicle coat component [Saxophila tyrrhenica]
MEVQQQHGREDFSGVTDDDRTATHLPGSQPEGNASWNPALRRDSDVPMPEFNQQDEDDDFFDRYSGATPKKQGQQQPIEQEQSPLRGVEAAEMDEPLSPMRRKSISVLSVIDVQEDDATPEELSRTPSHHVEVSGSFRRGADSFEEEDDEALPRPESKDEEKEILDPLESMAEQRVALEETMPETEAPNGDVEAGGAGERDNAEMERIMSSPSEHYEHQGEVTAMEEAIEPSADAPLIDDEEPLPTPGLVSREPTFPVQNTEDEEKLEFDGAASPRHPQLKSVAAPPKIDRSFTSNFSDSPVVPKQPQEQSIPNDWPSAGDDRTFGELLDHESQQQPIPADGEALEQIAAEESAQVASLDDDELLPEEEGEVKEEDLAAAWGEVLDDDELLLEDTPTDGGVDPSSFFGGGDDDDGFLQDEPAPAPSAPQHQRGASQPNAYQAPQQRPQYTSSKTTQIFGGQHGRSAGTPSTGLDDIYTIAGSVQQPPQYGQAQQPLQRPAMNQAQSFVDKAKGGYQSPYDLPMEVVKPRRRPQQTPHQSQQNVSGSAPAPPPRTSSMSSSFQPGQPQALPSRNVTGSVGSLSPPQSSGSTTAGQPAGALPQGRATGTPKQGSSGFFEDLPMTAKPRARPTGAYTPQQQQGGVPGMPTPPPSMGPPSLAGSRQNTGYMPQQMQQQQANLPQTPPVQQQQPPVYAGLRKPEQMDLLPQQPVQAPAQGLQPQPGQMPPVQKTRYSPNPQQQQPVSAAGSSSLSTPPAPPAASGRYSPAPASTQAAQVPSAAPARYSPAPQSMPAPAQAKPRNPSVPSNVHQFAPRTSSPLAGLNLDKPLPSSPPRASVQQHPQQQQMTPPEQPPPSRYAPSTDAVMQHPGMVQPPMNFSPPTQRPRTQSPDAAMKRPRVLQEMGRPSSSAGVGRMPQQQPQQAALPTRSGLPHRRQFSRDLTFAAPQDERSQDPLQRWKGYPIFKWSASGTVLSTSPKQTPFYAAGQGMPSVKCTPGPITIQDATTFMPLDDRTAKFPGPLTARSKRQKKDLLAWLETKISDLDRQTESVMLHPTLDPTTRKRTEEKLLLWRLLRVFVSHDGVLEGTPALEAESRAILLPNLAQMAQVADLQSPGSAAAAADPVDKKVLFQIRQALLEGQRERAVWLAEEKKLWGHAMLIASTLGPESWKQIVQSFVRSQVKSVGADARSTAALYQVFAGNSEECVDELVPPSARAGFQFIGVEDKRAGGDPLEGLDQWRETVGLVVGNRTANDVQSLLALGKLLQGYGRVEAAGVCWLFARQSVKLSGQDEEGVDAVLIGGNHSVKDEEGVLGPDLDAVLATEVYEYASSLSAQANSAPYLPHLQAYKLIHAQNLAASGLKTKAQVYCDAITSAYTSTTRPSPYYHPTFTSAVAEFSAFLAQTPHDGKAGFFSKPAMNKVSSGAASWFSKFVAGDEDSESNASGHGSEGGAGPFGGVSGESPDLSRTGSGTELYNPAMGAGMPIPTSTVPQQPAFAPSSGPSRYAPSSQGSQFTSGSLGATAKYAPPGQHSFAAHGFPAAEPQRPGSARYAPAPSSNSLGVPRPEAMRRGSENSLPYAPASRRGSAQDTSSVGSYEPRPLLADEGSMYSYSPAPSPLVQAQQAPAVQEPESAPLDAPSGTFTAQEPELDPEDGSGGGGYAPPTSGGYEPPSYSTYQPYEPDPESPSDTANPAPKKMRLPGEDSDDEMHELTRRAAALKKSQADRAADEAFRKAAEADAARDSKSNNRDSLSGEQKKGWLTGWFGGKKEGTASPGPIKAKLGEENSFYYDENLKKWVNKKGGAEAAAPVSATPPPPKGMSRGPSGMGGSGSGPPSRVGSMGPPPPRPGTSGTNASGSGVPGSGPPSRSATPASDAGGAAGPVGAVNGDTAAASAVPPSMAAPPMRPSSSLSTASSIDDLLAGGPPGAGGRKAGTVKKKKGGSRYLPDATVDDGG